MLDEDDEDLLCHECGLRFTHVVVDRRIRARDSQPCETVSSELPTPARRGLTWTGVLTERLTPDL